MRALSGRATGAPLAAFLLSLTPLAQAADWPAYRMDNARRATSPEKLQFPLAPVWTYVPEHGHQPAWPDPFLQRGRGKNFDVAPQTVAAGDLVYFGSTTDNTVWALDAGSGEVRWSFTTGGPVRFAPAVAAGRVFAVSDDGHAYCLDAATGELIWKFRGGLNGRRLPGNGRMISRWPARSGVAVQDGVVHFAAGMWSSEGVYVFALDARTGKEIWCNDTNLDYLPMPHASTALTGNMPQGYLAIGGRRVAYNNSVGGCWLYDSETGNHAGRSGGTGTLKKSKGGNYQEFKPSKFYNWSLLILDPDNGEILHHGAPEGTAAADGLVPLHAALAGDTLIRCLGNRVVAIGESGKGDSVWEHAFEETASGIAVANGRLIVSTTDGAIHCFKSGGGGKAKEVGPGTLAKRAPSTDPATEILGQIAGDKIDKGYALILGEPDAGLAEALAAATELQVICVLRDPAKVRSERRRLLRDTDLYGVRLTVDHLEDPAALPYPQLFANLIVARNIPPGLPEPEIGRVLRPCGGVLIHPDGATRRGKLKGALDWDSEVTSDQRVHGPLELLWFGEPGPTHSVKNTPSIAAGGRLFVYGPNGGVMSAVDAYNGTLLWQREIGKYNGMAADDDHLFLGSLVLDARSGEEIKSKPGKAPVRVRGIRSETDRKRFFAPREHPLTGGLSSKIHGRLHGCSSWAGSRSMEFFRSSTISYYDYEDDSGVRNFGGLRPGCGDSLNPALGLMLYGESTGIPHDRMGTNCSCAYPFKTSLALAPTGVRRHEDWAVFQDIPWVQSGAVRHAAVNCGAPGDRRDDERKLWLAAPRPQGPSGWAIYRNFTFTLPYKPEFFGEHRHFRRNAERLTVSGTDRPWLYASGYLGIKRLTWEIDYYNRYHQVLALPTLTAPAIDGQLDDPCWTGVAELLKPFTPPEHNRELAPDYADRPEVAYARYDDQRLYLSYRKRIDPDSKGRTSAIKANTSGTDAPVWEDDSFEIYLSDVAGERVIHLGVAASGATFDSLIKFPPLPEDKQEAKAVLNDKTGPEEETGWNGAWSSKVNTTKDQFVAELAIPWATLDELGIDRNKLRINLQHTRSRYARKPFTRKAHAGSQQLNLSKTEPAPKPYTVRMHFLEPVHERAGQRVFDVLIDGKVVLEDFDVFAEAGGKNRALVREFHGIPATQKILFEFRVDSELPTDDAAPILSGFEVIAEEPGERPPAVLAEIVRDKGSRKPKATRAGTGEVKGD